MAQIHAFKEWQVVCDALASGRQTILLRKGGIHEGRAGFSFAHDEFFLFPTRFHAQLDQVREGDFQQQKEWEEGDLLALTHYAKACFAVTLENWEQVERMLPYHIYSEQTIKDRFDWSGKGMNSGSIHLAFVKVLKLSEPWTLKYEKRLGGCRSWVELAKPPEVILENASPVISEEKFEELRSRIAGLAGVEEV